jgi:protein-S-isoprenylcysteine O-methyltransferase Ste14
LAVPHVGCESSEAGSLLAQEGGSGRVAVGLPVKFVLAIRSLCFLALLPGVVAGYVPYRILVGSGKLCLPALSLASVIASALSFLGVLVLLRCVWDFFAAGEGTLAPVDPPRRLVVGGLYRYTRNPMYNGVVMILVGEAWLCGSFSILTYAAGVLVAFHLFAVLYEEPVLEAKFGEAYMAYRRSVPRWGLTVHGYEA